ncbi:alpha/beta hydrolase [Nitrospirillum sp. BR 11828]|uniref:alpha/beta hydrolase n=1 Tax=Nitrospirillum sp. BR 11828 TaxID=3104325 RepID=UPI002ACAC15C|nr:alpha/beta hydrolase [Nitrospirillum sp. BR 11828]MDZ5649490.1 alpha/beta hydrolase [Nitrospirillum sp. BR 11828]
MIPEAFPLSPAKSGPGPRLDRAAYCLTLDPGVQSFLDRVVEAGLLPYRPGLDPAARQGIAARLQESAAPVADAVVQVPVPDGDVALRIAWPPGADGKRVPVVFYLHGGVWALGGWATHGGAAAALAQACDAALVFVEPGLAPAALALRHARAALDWVRAHGHELGLDITRVAVVGDGSGCAMAVLLAAGLPPSDGFRAQVLFHPLVGKAAPDAPATPWLDHGDLAALLPPAFPGQPAWTGLSPLELPPDRLRRLPPTLILAAEADLAREGGEALARRMMGADVETSAIRLMGCIHDFFWLDGLADTAPSRAAFAVARATLTDAFDR